MLCNVRLKGESLRSEKSSSDANRQAVVRKVAVVVTRATVGARVRSSSGSRGIFRVHLVGMVWNYYISVCSLSNVK